MCVCVSVFCLVDKMCVFCFFFVFYLNFSCFSVIVRMGNFFELGVVESLFGSDVLCGVVDKDFGK